MSTPTPLNPPAFPSGESYSTIDLGGCKTQRSKGPLHRGLSLRDYFAAKAIHLFSIGSAEMNEILAGEEPNHEVVAKFCYDLADAMLRERMKQ